MNEKTLLKLHENGHVETFVPTDIGAYSFSKNSIQVPQVIEYPPNELKNYFIQKTSVAGWVADFEHNGNPSGEINPPYENNDRTSDFIDVSEWNDFTVRIVQKNLGTLIDSFRVLTYDSNKQFKRIFYEEKFNLLYDVGILIATLKATLNDDDKYIRVSINHYDNPTVINKITVNKGYTSSEKYYLAVEDMPEWVKDTGNPISIFNEGIVIKGDLIQSVEELESDIIFSDNFNRTDSYNLGGNWVIARGGWVIENNMVKPTTSNNILFCTHPYSDNVSISADVIRNLSEGIIVRGRDSNNYLYVQFEKEYLRIKTVTNGTVSVLATFYLNSVTNRTYRARVELRGIEIKVFINDVLCITHETSAYLNEYLSGFQSWTDNTSIGRFDNFSITRL